MKDITDDDALFKTIHPINTGDFTRKGRCQLVTTAFDHIFVASDEDVKVLQSSLYEKTSSETKQLKDKPLTNIDFVFTLKIIGCPCWLSTNQDETTLAVCLQRDAGCFACIYDTRDLIEGKNNLICEVRLGDTPVASLVNFAWNPEDPNSFAILLSDGAFRLFNLTDKLSIVAALQKSDFHSFCWSPKGKQIVVAKFSGDLVQLDLRFQTKRIISLGDFYKNLSEEFTDPIISDIIWISSFVFFINITSDSNEEDQPGVYTSAVISAPKDGPIEPTVLDCVSCIDEDIAVNLGSSIVSLQLFNSPLLLHQLQWPLLLLGLASTEELSLVFINPSTPQSVRVVDLKDNAKAPIPIGSSITGLSLNVCSRINPTCPLVLVSLDCGQIYSFYLTLQGYTMPNFRAQADQNYARPRRVMIGDYSYRAEQRPASSSRSLVSSSPMHPIISSHQPNSVSLPSSPRRTTGESVGSQRQYAYDDMVPSELTSAGGGSVSEVIRSALEQFTQELQLSWMENSRCLQGSADVYQEKPSLSDVLEKTDRFTSAVDELSRVTREIARETDELKTDTVNSHSFADRGRLALLHSSASVPQRSLISRQLDPRTAGQLASLKKQYKTVETLLGDVSTQLDDIFNQLETRKRMADYENHHRGYSNRTGGHPARRLNSASSSYTQPSSRKSIISGNMSLSRRASWDSSGQQPAAISEICRTLKCNAQLIQMEEYRLANLIDRLHLATSANQCGEESRSDGGPQFRPLDIQLRRDHELIQSLHASPPTYIKSSPGTVLKATPTSMDRLRSLERSFNSSINESGDGSRIRAHLEELERTKFSPGRVVSTDFLPVNRPTGDGPSRSSLAQRSTPLLSSSSRLGIGQAASRSVTPSFTSAYNPVQSQTAASVSDKGNLTSANNKQPLQTVGSAFPSKGDESNHHHAAISYSGGKSELNPNLGYVLGGQSRPHNFYTPPVSTSSLNNSTGSMSRSLNITQYSPQSTSSTYSSSQQDKNVSFVSSTVTALKPDSQSQFSSNSLAKPSSLINSRSSEFQTTASFTSTSTPTTINSQQFYSSGQFNQVPSANMSSTATALPTSSTTASLFGPSPSSTNSALFTNLSLTSQPSGSSGLFPGQNLTSQPSGSSGLFPGQNLTSQSTGSSGLFPGQNLTSQPSGGSGLFSGQSLTSQSTGSSGLFSSQNLTSQPSGSNGLFPGQALTSQSSGSSGLFSNFSSSNSSSGNLFGTQSNMGAGTTSTSNFGNSNDSQQNIGGLFGNAMNLGGSQTSSSGGLFGGPTTTTTTSNVFGGGSLFGSVSKTTNTQNLFGNTTSTPFGASVAATQSAGGHFGSATPSSTSNGPFSGGSLFGNTSTTSTNSSATFGATTSAGGLFGGSSSTNSGGLFGGTSSFNSQQSGGLFGTSPATGSTQQGLFGSSASTSSSQGLFGGGGAGTGQPASGGLFTGTSSSLFGATSRSTVFGAGPTFGGNPVFTSMTGAAAPFVSSSGGGGLFGSTNNTGSSLFSSAANSNVSFSNLVSQPPNQTVVPQSGQNFPQNNFGSSPSFTQRRV